jgi:hypothetical protein
VPLTTRNVPEAFALPLLYAIAYTSDSQIYMKNAKAAPNPAAEMNAGISHSAHAEGLEPGIAKELLEDEDVVNVVVTDPVETAAVPVEVVVAKLVEMKGVAAAYQ